MNRPFLGTRIFCGRVVSGVRVSGIRVSRAGVSRIRISRASISRTGTGVLIGFSGGRIFLTVVGVPSWFISAVFLGRACFIQNGIPL